MGGRRGKPAKQANSAPTNARVRTRLAALAKIMKRQALHASKLAFRHPVSGAWLEFRSALPGDMQRTLEMLYCEDWFKEGRV